MDRRAVATLRLAVLPVRLFPRHHHFTLPSAVLLFILPLQTTHHSPSPFFTNVDPLANAFFLPAPFFVSCDSTPRGSLLRSIHWCPTASSLSRLVLPSSYKPFASPRRIPLQHCSGVSSRKSWPDPFSRVCLASRFPHLPSSPLCISRRQSGRDYTSSSPRPVPFL